MEENSERKLSKDPGDRSIVTNTLKEGVRAPIDS